MNTGKQVLRRRIRRIMKQEGLVSHYTTIQFKPQKDICNESKTQNILDRQFHGQGYRDVVISDLTYVRVGACWNYLCVLVDLYNREIIGYSAGEIEQEGKLNKFSRPLTPYCVSKLIQLFLGCYRFYIYPKRPKINTFQKGIFTHAWVAIVFLVGFAALLIIGSVKFNDNPFFRCAIVIFCTQKYITIFYEELIAALVTVCQGHLHS